MTPDILRKCVIIRGGIELWIDTDRADRLAEALKSASAPKFIDVDGQYVNTFEILGIFTAASIEEKNRRRNGQWKCNKGNWHEKAQGCGCPTYTETVKAYVEGVGEIEYKR